MMTLKEKTLRQITLATAHRDFSKGLNLHAFFKIHNSTLSEDLVQNTFIKTWKYMVNGGKINTMKAFLYHILNHLIIDEYRKHKTVSLDSMIENGFDTSNDDHSNILNIIDGKAASKLIEKLPLAYKKIIKMRYMQDLSLKEMSAITGQTKNALSVQAYRGLEKLRILLSGKLA